MRIKVLGGGFYGCSIALSLINDGHDVEVHEIRDRLFGGASGNIPARLHAGAFHYPRSHATRKACLEHKSEFLARYGFLTRNIPINIYAIAKDNSLIDFETYREVLTNDALEFITAHDPAELGLTNVEGAVLTGERHIVCDKARNFFTTALHDHIRYLTGPDDSNEDDFDLIVDATFCAQESAGVDRYEPCLVVLLKGPVDKSVTIMDGPYPSLYTWDERFGLSSLSSAKWTPFSKTCKTYQEAQDVLNGLDGNAIALQGESMIESMREFYPAIDQYTVYEYRTSIRAMPLSGSDTRLCDVIKAGPKTIRVRAGKIDAVIQAERLIKELMQ